MLDSYISIDLETTGLSPEKDKIIEIGAVKIKEGKVVEEYQQLINPGVPISYQIYNITGINDEMVKNQPCFADIADGLWQFLGDEVLLGHNVRFDFSFLKTNFQSQRMSLQNKTVDTLFLAKRLLEEPKSKSLGSLCEYYDIVNERAHRALQDAIATAKLYEVISAKYEKEAPETFLPKPVFYKVKKQEPMTERQKNYLNDLIKYHKIENAEPCDGLTKSEASKRIDQIIFQYGRLQ